MIWARGLSVSELMTIPPIMQKFLDAHANTSRDECWIWPGYVDRSGYGRVSYRNKQGREGGTSAPRLAYAVVVGDVPQGAVMDHYVCDGGPTGCANPYHVRPVSPAENTLRGDGPAARNLAKTHCHKGHPLPSALLGTRDCRECARQVSREHQALLRRAADAAGMTITRYKRYFGHSGKVAERIIAERGY